MTARFHPLIKIVVSRFYFDCRRLLLPLSLLLLVASAPAGFIYWSEGRYDVMPGTSFIKRKSLDGSGPVETIYSADEISAIAVTEGNLYWTESPYIEYLEDTWTLETTNVFKSDLVGNGKSTIESVTLHPEELRPPGVSSAFLDIATDGTNVFYRGFYADTVNKWDGSAITRLGIPGWVGTGSLAFNSTNMFAASSTDDMNLNQIDIYNMANSQIGSFSISPSAGFDFISATDTYVYLNNPTDGVVRYNTNGAGKTILDAASDGYSIEYVEEGGDSYLFYETGGNRLNLIKNGGASTLFYTAGGGNAIGSIEGLAGALEAAGGSSAPEPASVFASLGLLSAAGCGLREWRRRKKKAA
jgi:hypothetical protein